MCVCVSVCVCGGRERERGGEVFPHMNVQKVYLIPKPRGIPPSACSGTLNLSFGSTTLSTSLLLGLGIQGLYKYQLKFGDFGITILTQIVRVKVQNSLDFMWYESCADVHQSCATELNKIVNLLHNYKFACFRDFRTTALNLTGHQHNCYKQRQRVA